MIREKNNIINEKKVAPFNGTGEITVRNLLNGDEEMYNHGRVFAHTTVYDGSEIGVHRHINESETYYILSGTGLYNDNGNMVEVHAGDVYFYGDGEIHGIRAIGSDIEMIALILYRDELLNCE